MLIKHESFDISQIRKSESRNGSDKLYEAKKYPYLKYFLIPGIVGFMLLCILVNVDFKHGNNRGNAKPKMKTKLENDETTIRSVTDSLKIKGVNDEQMPLLNRPKENYYPHKSNLKSALPTTFVFMNDKKLIDSDSAKKGIGNVRLRKPCDGNTNLAPRYSAARVANLSENKHKYGINQRPDKLSSLISISEASKQTTTTRFGVKIQNINVGNFKLLRNEDKNTTEYLIEKTGQNNVPRDKLENKTSDQELKLVPKKDLALKSLHLKVNQGQKLENTTQLSPSIFEASTISQSLLKDFNDFESDQIRNAISNRPIVNFLSRIKRNASLTSNAIPAIKCTRDVDACILKCDTGGLSHLDQDLEDFQPSCGQKDITLELKNCVFLNGIMKSNFFTGFFSLEELHIIDCNLTTFQDGVFKVSGAQKLRVLKFIDNAIDSMTDTTFVGLTKLKHFEFSQHVHGEQAIGSNFLSPLAASLTSVKILQSLDNNARVDPRAWLQGPNFVALYIVDYKNNNLQGMLKADTFKSLTAVGNINLQFCSLRSIDIKTFLPVLNTLDYLCLDHNELITLDAPFLDQLGVHHVTLSATNNDWQCDCDHYGMIDYMQNEYDNQYIDKEQFICSGPPDTKDQYMVNLVIRCEEETTQTPITDDDMVVTTSSSIAPTTSTHKPVDTTTPDGGTDPSQLENIVCFSQDEVVDNITISLRPQTAYLTFIPTSTTSVTIILSINTTGLSLIQFLNYSQYITLQPTSPNEWQTKNLIENHSYMFCLLHGSNVTVSPFDCWAYSVGISGLSAWLLSNDKGWFVSVMFLVALFFCAAGGGAVYFTLSRRPSWLLTTNERIMRVNHSSHKIILLPKRSSIIERDSSTTGKNSYQRAKTASYLSPKPHCEVYSTAHSAYYASLHKPPTDRAPALPDIAKVNACRNAGSFPRPSLEPLHNPVGQRQRPFRAEENDYGYNSINHYEEIRF